MQARSNEIGTEIIQVEAQQAELTSANKPANATLDERLEKLYRENLKLCEEVQHIIEGKSNDMNLLDSLKILAGLREASEESAAAQNLTQAPPARAATGSSGKLSRPTKKGSKSGAAAVPAVEEDAEVAAAPSPRISLSSRLNAKDKSSRAGSVPTTREASVKLEDGAESVASSADGATSTATGHTTTASKSGGGGGSSTRPSNRLVLTKGEIVFCRHDHKSRTSNSSGEPLEGEGILCRVTAVIGEGKQRRYEVQDADTSGEAPPPQRASVSQLIQIPETNKGLGELGRGRQVLAQYPDTTTFYKAEVQEGWKGEGKGSEWVKLRFEEDEFDKEVERRFVLTEK